MSTRGNSPGGWPKTVVELLAYSLALVSIVVLALAGVIEAMI